MTQAPPVGNLTTSSAGDQTPTSGQRALPALPVAAITRGPGGARRWLPDSDGAGAGADGDGGPGARQGAGVLVDLEDVEHAVVLAHHEEQGAGGVDGEVARPGAHPGLEADQLEHAGGGIGGVDDD